MLVSLETGPRAAPTTAPAPSASSSPAAGDRLREIDGLIASGALDEAETAVAALLTTLAADAAPRWRADVLLRVARLRRAQGRHADADAPLRTAGEVYETLDEPGALGDVWRERAGVHWALGRQVEASIAYDQAALAFARAGRIHDQAGALRSSTFGTRHASRTARQAIRLAALALIVDLDDVDASHRYARGALLHDIGDAAFGDGLYGDADRAYRAAESLLEVDVENRRALSLLLTSRGRLERAHGYPERALPLYERALALQEATRYDFGISQTLNALAYLHQLHGRHAEARDLLERIVTRHADTAPGWRGLLMRLNAAAAMLRAGDAPAAIAALDAYYGANGAREVGAVHRLPEVDILVAARRLTEALGVADAIVRDAERTGLAGEFRALAHLRRATVLQHLGQPSAALDDLALASAQWEAMRRTLTASDFVKRGFAEVTARTFYPHYIQALASAGDSMRALEAAELARGRAFADLLAQRHADSWRPPAAAVASGGPAMRGLQRDLLTSRTVSQHGPALRGGSLTTIEPPPDVAVDSLVHAEPLAAVDLRQLADAEQAVVAVYWQGEDETLLWVLRPGGEPTMHRVSVGGPALTRLVEEASAAAPPITARGASPRRTDRRPAATMPEARARLHTLLIAPLADAVARHGRLVVIPHGALARLSFATLVDRRGRYLIEHASVRYAPSLTVLRQLRQPSSARPGAAARAVVIGEPRLPASLQRDGRLPALPGARAEAVAVARALARHGISADVLSGADASESALRGRASDAAIVHVAAHGIISDVQPMTSFLALASSGVDDSNDGRLTAAEVYQLHLRADLVVLSGCRTADGPLTGDGLSGLTRAFFAAGARSVVASFWDLPDVTAARVLPAFYRAWQGAHAPDKAEALRRAQLQVIGQLRRGEISVRTRVGPMVLAEHPALWGGLAVIGAP
jgi:CHAT domain-containing protein/tetratricopeptide (TPR) repeat protein